MALAEIIRTPEAGPVPMRPLPAYAYRNPRLLEEEYDRLFRATWQFVCHESEVKKVGEFATLDLWRDSILVLRGDDGVLRAFQNVCRHRAMPLATGSGRCKSRLTCPYHAWSYRLDGSLAGVPGEQNFPGLDKSTLGLKQLSIDVFFGLVFVRIEGKGPSVAEQWGELARWARLFRTEEMVRSREDNSNIWDANWKVAVENNLENYHVPIGHPGYYRLLGTRITDKASDKGVSISLVSIRDKLSSNWSERHYQRLLPAADFALDEESANIWAFSGMAPNMGINFYPDSMDVFQILPLGPEKCLARNPIYVRPGVNRAGRAVQWLNARINRQVGREDRFLCESVQRGLGSTGYAPGPLSQLESAIGDFHDLIRGACPSADRQSA